MKIQEQDRYHGVALMQIVEHDSFKALNKATKSYGHYLVNTDRHVFVKYRTNSKSPWIFVFAPSELRAIEAQIKAGHPVFVALVCGSETVCALNQTELSTVIGLGATASQSIRVEIPRGGSCHVSGTKGALKLTVPHNAFPPKIFT